MKLYIVDAFTKEQFKGNPAAVCVLEKELSDDMMQKIARENNLSETAFVKKEGEAYSLRWFTPGCEVSLCGHGSLATAFVLANFYDTNAKEFTFNTLSGEIKVKRMGERFQLDMPAQSVMVIKPSEEVLRAVGIMPVETFFTCDVVCVLEKEEDVYNFQPDFEKIAAIPDGEGLIITAPSKEYDFVSRCFYPKEAINEDPVTGSAHCSLVPYWSNRLGKDTFLAYQASARGGELFCEDRGERIFVSGHAVLYSVADLYFDGK